MNKHLSSLAVALCCGASAAAFAAQGMSKDQYKALKDRIEAQYKMDKSACEGMQGNAKDLCQAQARGKQKVAKAELGARYKPSARADEKVKEAQADAQYRIARQKCEDLKGNDRKVCGEQAKADRVALKDQGRAARVAAEKGANSQAALRERANARNDEADAGFALARARCDALQGNAKDQCVADAKRTFNKT